MATAVATSVDDELPEYGPAMSALPAKRQRFVVALFEAPLKTGALRYAAAAAGYGTPESSRESLSVIASRIVHDSRVQAALQEEAIRRRQALAPEAITALSNLIRNPEHPQHVRAVGMVLDRTDPIVTTHNVRVEHHQPATVEATAAVLRRIEDLARRAGVALPPPPTIDGEFKVVTDGGGT